MLDLSFDALVSAKFRVTADSPVIRHPLGPVIADPSLLTPDLSPDGRWHLFAHSLAGVRRYVSDDGFSFSGGRVLFRRAMHPDIKRVGGEYILTFERVQPLLPRGLTLLGGRWKSEIWVSRSPDLVTFSEPRPLLVRDGRDSERAGKGWALSNPFLLEDDGKFRLYYSSGLTFVKDCGFSEPTHICLAESDLPLAGYVKRPQPLISPDPSSELFNICSGCLKVYRLRDGYAGVQNGIYTKNGRSESAINLLRSDDGVKFEFVRTLLAPARDGSWMSQFVYASHLVLAPDGSLRLYFNARDRADITGTENIGVAVAE